MRKFTNSFLCYALQIRYNLLCQLPRVWIIHNEKNTYKSLSFLPFGKTTETLLFCFSFYSCFYLCFKSPTISNSKNLFFYVLYRYIFLMVRKCIFPFLSLFVFYIFIIVRYDSKKVYLFLLVFVCVLYLYTFLMLRKCISSRHFYRGVRTQTKQTRVRLRDIDSGINKLGLRQKMLTSWNPAPVQYLRPRVFMQGWIKRKM